MVDNLVLTLVLLFVLGSILIALQHEIKKVLHQQRRKDWLKYFTYILIISFIIYMACINKIYVMCILLVIVIGGALEVYHNVKNYFPYPLLWFVLTFIFLTFCLGHLIVDGSQNWHSSFIYFFILVSVMDSFSQLWGKLLGKNKFCPNISPGKTWEGFWGGILSTIIVSFVFSFLMPGMSQLSRAFLTVIISLTAVSGDLLFSSIKRRLSIKDFSNLLPGQGGILDRFDSLVLSAPVFYWLNKFLT